MTDTKESNRLLHPRKHTAGEAIGAAVSAVACIDRLKRLVPLDREAWSLMARIEASVRVMEAYTMEQAHPKRPAYRDTEPSFAASVNASRIPLRDAVATVARVPIGRIIVPPEPERPTVLVKHPSDPVMLDYIHSLGEEGDETVLRELPLVRGDKE